MDAVEVADRQRAGRPACWIGKAAKDPHEGSAGSGWTSLQQAKRMRAEGREGSTIIRVGPGPARRSGRAGRYPDAKIAAVEQIAKRIVILISGRGSNMEAIVTACRTERWSAEVACVIASRPDAAGLAFARGAGIATVALDAKARAVARRVRGRARRRHRHAPARLHRARRLHARAVRRFRPPLRRSHAERPSVAAAGVSRARHASPRARGRRARARRDRALRESGRRRRRDRRAGRGAGARRRHARRARRARARGRASALSARDRVVPVAAARRSSTAASRSTPRSPIARCWSPHERRREAACATRREGAAHAAVVDPATCAGARRRADARFPRRRRRPRGGAARRGADVRAAGRHAARSLVQGEPDARPSRPRADRRGGLRGAAPQARIRAARAERHRLARAPHDPARSRGHRRRRADRGDARRRGAHVAASGRDGRPLDDGGRDALEPAGLAAREARRALRAGRARDARGDAQPTRRRSTCASTRCARAATTRSTR